MKKEQLERVCCNCNYFFPSRPEISEYGICLEDSEFDPFIDELLENLNYSCCQDLIREKEFTGDKDACNQYEEAEFIGIDDYIYSIENEIGTDCLSEGDINTDLTPEEWWGNYWEMDEDKQFNFLKHAIDLGIIIDSDLEPGLVEAVISLFGNLFRRKKYGQMFELEEFLQSRKVGIPDNDRHYIDFYLLEFHLFNRDAESIKKCLQSFTAAPVESIDLLTPILDKLNYYGYSELALEVSREVYHRVRDSDRLIGGAGEDFARTVLMNEFQKLYQLNGQTAPVNREELYNRLAIYDYVEIGELEPALNALLNDTNCSILSYQDFKENKRDFYHALSTSFLKYVFEEKGFNFPTAYDIWLGAWDCFSKEAAEENDSLDRFFELDQNNFDEYIYGRFDFLSNKKPHAAAVLWGIPYVYNFLKMNQLISEEIALEALQSITMMKMELIEAREDSLWEYSFVHSWGRPDSVEEEDFLSEKEYFERTFAEKADVNDYLSAEYFTNKSNDLKTIRNKQTVKYDEPKKGRNEPCPCGSGKKYKKCCGR